MGLPSMAVRSEKVRLDQKTVGFSALYEITKILGDPMDLPQGFTAILRILNSFMGMTKGALSLYDLKRRELSIEAAFGMTDEEQHRGRYRLGEGITGKVMKLGIPMAIPDISKEPHFLNKTRAREARDLHGIAFICLPIKIAGEILGVLSVERPSRDARASVEEDLRVLTVVASLIGHAVKLRREQARNLEALDGWKGLRDLERELVMMALKETAGVQVKAAARLGITPRQLAYKMQKHRIIKEFRIES
ncbi:MAG: GAF domain-containing protein [Candidatus Methylomirabilis oxyfera]|nr:GAF domain-containing protein [Candidatus Methylomirabilis oxyfera]